MPKSFGLICYTAVGNTYMFEGRGEAAAILFFTLRWSRQAFIYLPDIVACLLAYVCHWNRIATKPATTSSFSEFSSNFPDFWTKCVFTSVMRGPASPTRHPHHEGWRYWKFMWIPVCPHDFQLMLRVPACFHSPFYTSLFDYLTCRFLVPASDKKISLLETV